MSEKVAKFKAANGQSPVVYAEVIGLGGQGATYILEDGSSFTLTADECAAIGKPRWSFQAYEARAALHQDSEEE